MKTTILAAAGAALSLAAPLAAQSAQDRLDARYDRALAAGYKALFLCSATANAERLDGSRTADSIHQWELTGIYPKLDPIVRDLPFEIVRRQAADGSDGPVDHVRVAWSDQMPPRVAGHIPGDGCFIQPIGAPVPEAQALPSDYEAEAIPEDGWSSDPSAISARAAERLGTAAFDGTYGEGSRTTAALIVKDGQIVMENYAPGFDAATPQRTWSVAKSIAATLVGAAVQSGEFAVADPIGINYWRSGGGFDARNAITIDHALRMATGRYTDTPGNRTDPLYWGGATVDERATTWPVIHPPGTVYRYANNDTLMAIKGVEGYIGYYGAKGLLERFGMHRTIAETDWRGGYVLSSQVWATARDLARLGQLHLDDGMVDGERMLPEGWSDYVSDPSGPQPEGRQWGYGAGWWTFRRPEGNAFEGVPDDAFAARGNRGQYVVVVPSRNIVIVRRGEDMVGTRFDIAAFTRDVLAALED
ncbi:MAG: serine hydrolase [Erythrobacter sp.]|nr:serine hydrolase [Erythrobacter sp.]